MFSIPSKFLIVILALLQLVAPLVHAHADEKHSSQEIHLPGLEHFDVTPDSSTYHATTQPAYKTYSIISVGTGIKHKKVFTNNASLFYLPVKNFCFTTVNKQTLFLLLPQKQTLPAIAQYTLLPTRAPPILFYTKRVFFNPLNAQVSFLR